MADLEKLINDILQEMYAEAQPPLDFKEAIANPDEMDDGWYRQHYLSDEEQERIFEKHIEQHNLTDREYKTLQMEVRLNLAPTSVQENDKN